MAGSGSHLHFFIFVIIYMIIIGLVASVFNPAMYSFGEEDYIGQDESGREQGYPDEESHWWDPILDFFNNIVSTIVVVATFLWSGLTLNIPGVPVIIKIIMCSPIWAGMGYLIATYVRGV